MMKVLLTGTAVAVTTSVALSLAARLRHRSAVQPINATSHWLHGERAGRESRPDFQHTALGSATHFAASLLWSALFAWWRSGRPPGTLVSDAIGTTVLAAFVDYAVVPKRLTPGWELVLPKSGIAAAYGVMALTLATCDRCQASSKTGQ